MFFRLAFFVQQNIYKTWASCVKLSSVHSSFLPLLRYTHAPIYSSCPCPGWRHWGCTSRGYEHSHIPSGGMCPCFSWLRPMTRIAGHRENVCANGLNKEVSSEVAALLDPILIASLLPLQHLARSDFLIFGSQKVTSISLVVMVGAQ